MMSMACKVFSGSSLSHAEQRGCATKKMSNWHEHVSTSITHKTFLTQFYTLDRLTICKKRSNDNDLLISKEAILSPCFKCISKWVFLTTTHCTVSLSNDFWYGQILLVTRRNIIVMPTKILNFSMCSVQVK